MYHIIIIKLSGGGGLCLDLEGTKYPRTPQISLMLMTNTFEDKMVVVVDRC